MYLGDQLAGVHLTLQQGAGETSAVDIRVDAGDEQLEAHLQVNGEHIEGYLVGNTPEEVTKLEKTSDILLERIMNGFRQIPLQTGTRKSFLLSAPGI